VPPPLQLESLASFSAVIDRLGEFQEVVQGPLSATSQEEALRGIQLQDVGGSAPQEARPVAGAAVGGGDGDGGRPLLELERLTLRTPDGRSTLVEGLELAVGARSRLAARCAAPAASDRPRACAYLFLSGGVWSNAVLE
jgi:ABC-type uncharacterized transport system fused permease/ATPase subunit